MLSQLRGEDTMACRFSALIGPRTLAFVACLITAIAGPVSPAASSSPDPSNGCKAQQRVPAGNYSQKQWPIIQSGTNGQDVGRIFSVHVPKQHEDPQSRPLPVVINLHGSGGNGADHDKWSRMSELGDAVGFVVATPSAWPWSQWTAFEELPQARHGISDVDFIRRLLKTIADNLCIDRNRIYATGHSNGGLMSAALGRFSSEEKLGDHKIAAVAPVAAIPLPGDMPLTTSGVSAEAVGDQLIRGYIPEPFEAFLLCRPARPREPIPMHTFFANQDRLVANGACYGTYGQAVSELDEIKRSAVRARACECYDKDPQGSLMCQSRPAVRGNVDFLTWFAQCAVNRWALENGCAANMDSPLPTGNSGWGVPAGTVNWNCSAVADSRGETFLTIFDTTDRPGHPNNIEQPNGHIWPGGAKPYDASDFNLTRAIWSFFENHPR